MTVWLGVAWLRLSKVVSSKFVEGKVRVDFLACGFVTGALGFLGGVIHPPMAFYFY